MTEARGCKRQNFRKLAEPLTDFRPEDRLAAFGPVAFPVNNTHRLQRACASALKEAMEFSLSFHGSQTVQIKSGFDSEASAVELLQRGVLDAGPNEGEAVGRLGWRFPSPRGRT